MIPLDGKHCSHFSLNGSAGIAGRNLSKLHIGITFQLVQTKDSGQTRRAQRRRLELNHGLTFRQRNAENDAGFPHNFEELTAVQLRLNDYSLVVFEFRNTPKL